MKVELHGDGKVLCLTGEIQCEDPPYLAAALNDAGRKDLVIYIASPGGYTTAAWSMHDLIRGYPGWVTTIAAGDCHSAAATFLLQAGDTRLMTRHSLLMWHEGSMSTSEESWSSAEAWVRASREEHLRTVEFMLKIVRVAKPKTSAAQLRKKIQSDWILNAEEALEWGLIDEVWNG